MVVQEEAVVHSQAVQQTEDPVQRAKVTLVAAIAVKRALLIQLAVVVVLVLLGNLQLVEPNQVMEE
jgi:hypothetical protein